jgi:hypothetical protein
MEQHTGSDTGHLYVDIITVRITYGMNIRLYTHTREHFSIRYDDTFYEETVSVILYGILCCFM